jgi:hypothetical protein
LQHVVFVTDGVGHVDAAGHRPQWRVISFLSAALTLGVSAALLR